MAEKDFWNVDTYFTVGRVFKLHKIDDQNKSERMDALKNAEGQNSSSMNSTSDVRHEPNYMTWEEIKKVYAKSLIEGGFIDKHGNDKSEVKKT